MERSVQDMLIWEEKKKLRREILKEEKENIEFDFHPSIKTGPRTRPRFADNLGVPKPYETEKPEPTPSEVAKMRREMIPKISEISRNLAGKSIDSDFVFLKFRVPGHLQACDCPKFQTSSFLPATNKFGCVGLWFRFNKTYFVGL